MSGRTAKSSRSTSAKTSTSENGVESVISGLAILSVAPTRRRNEAPSSTTPTSSSSSNRILMNSSLLPYQYKRDVKISTEVICLPNRQLLPKTHRPLRLGLGTPAGNLKITHIVNSKRETAVVGTIRQYVTRKKQKEESSKLSSVPSKILTPITTIGDSNKITSKIKMLTIYESPKSAGDFSKDGSRKMTSTINPTNSLTGKVFLTLNKKANYLAALNRKVTFKIGSNVKEISVAPKKKENTDEDGTKAVFNLCRHFRNILGWKLSIHLSWKYTEGRIKSWYSGQSPILTLQEIGEVLKISGDQIKNFQFGPEMDLMFDLLRKNLCHSTFPSFARLMALSKIQQGKIEAAGRYISEQCGMYLQSEIIDKHLTYIRRSDEVINIEGDVEKEMEKIDKAKSDIFWEQVNTTLNFSNSTFGVDGEKDFRRLSTFDPDWNIVQISVASQISNRFGYDTTGRQAVPQLFLSAFGFLPGEISERTEFTTVCFEPKVAPGSQMRYGLIDTFEKLLDKNLMISDDKVVISRKKYWEERGKHNEIIESVMYAMEDWISPWSFLLPGTISDKTIRKKIYTEILFHPTLKKCSNSQKLVIFRLTENYNVLPVLFKNVLSSLVAFILKLNVENVQSLTMKIVSIGSTIPEDVSRHPTILILDQEIDILPWDWLPCLRSTNVTRMPSLNLIKSTRTIGRHIGLGENGRGIDKDKCTFLLNPDLSLPQVQDRLEKYFRDRETWVPVVARSPTSEEMQHALETQHLFLYCGHGAGSSFYPEYAIQKLICKAIPVLMGCSSAQSHFSGIGLYSYSSVHAYLTAGCTSVVGFLWEVTDTECDRITAEFVERWLPHRRAKLPKMPMFDSDTKREHDPELPVALRKSRAAATQLLTQCAAVCCGLPSVRVS